MARIIVVAAASFLCGAFVGETPQQPPPAQDPTRPIDSREEQSTEMRGALSKWIDADLREVPLVQAMQFLSTQAGVSIVLDDTSLANAMVDKDAPISIHVKRLRLTSVLQLILDPLNLTLEFRPDVIVVIDKESNKKTNVEKAYPAADLVLNGARGWIDPHGVMLVRLMEDLIDRDVWEPNGGDATMHFFDPTLSLVVHAPPDTQQNVYKLLAMLRTSRGRTVQLLEERELGKLEDLLVALADAPNAPMKLSLPPAYPTSTQFVNALIEIESAKAKADQALQKAEEIKAQLKSLKK